MTRRRQSWILIASCMALIVVRLLGAHVHLCFDGMEPRAATHVFDSGAHDEPGSHEDEDVSFSDGLVKKAGAFVIDMPAFATFIIVLALASLSSGQRWSSRRQIDLPASPHLLRPPLRGPPSILA